MEMRRMVVVGCGSIGQRHARLLAKRSDVCVELCDPNQECLSAAREIVGDVKCHANFAEMLATRPEMVLIATPHRFHADQTVAALQAGAHVLCEKPMSDNLADAQRMMDAAESHLVLNVGFHLHFHPALARLRELITSGELGTVVHMHCRVGTYATLVCSRSRHQIDMEGALLLDYAHQPDLLYWFLGKEPCGVRVAAVLGGDLPLQSNPNVLSLTLDYDSPLLATVHLNYIQMPQRHEYEVVGDRAWAVLDMETNRLRIGRRETDTVTTESFAIVRDALYEAEHQAFFDAVDGQREPESPPARAIVSMRVIDAAFRSWKNNGRRETISVPTPSNVHI